MKYAIIAFRNLSRQKKRSFLIASAVALGVFIMISVNAFTAGGVRILKENVANMVGGHVFVTIERKVGDDIHSYIEDDSQFFEIAQSMGVEEKDISRSLRGGGTIIHAGNVVMMPTLIGLDWDDVDVPELQQQLGIDAEGLTAIRSDPRALIINKKSANNLKVSLNDEVIVRLNTITGQQNVGDFVVRYITQDEGDIMAFVAFGHQKTLAQLLNMPSESAYTTFQVRLASIDLAPEFAEQFKQRAAESFAIKPPRTNNFNFSSNVFKLDASTQEWEGIRLSVTTVNELLSAANMIVDGILIFSLIVFLVLLFITVIGILNTFRVILMERTVEIGTMRALGMQKPNVRSLILWEALFLSLSGFLVGFVLSIIVQFGLSLIPFGTTNPLSILLQNGYLNFRIELASTLIILGMVVLFTLLAALFPATKAAKLEPAHALRTAN